MTSRKARNANPPSAGSKLDTEAYGQRGHPLDGLYFHTFTEDGWLQYQARVIGVDDDYVLAQMFSAIDGSPTQIKPFPKSFLYSDQCKLYGDADVWRDKYLQESRRYLDHIRASKASEGAGTTGSAPGTPALRVPPLAWDSLEGRDPPPREQKLP